MAKKNEVFLKIIVVLFGYNKKKYYLCSTEKEIITTIKSGGNTINSAKDYEDL